MFDITIDGKVYDFIDKYEIDSHTYIVFEDDDGIYVNEIIIENNETKFLPIDIDLQKKILNTLEIEYE